MTNGKSRIEKFQDNIASCIFIRDDSDLYTKKLAERFCFFVKGTDKPPVVNAKRKTQLVT